MLPRRGVLVFTIAGAIVTLLSVGPVWADLAERTSAALTPDEVTELTRLLTLVAAGLTRESPN